MVFPGNTSAGLRFYYPISSTVSLPKNTKTHTGTTDELWEAVKHRALPQKQQTAPRLSFKGLLFGVEGLNVAIHVGHFYPGRYFISPSERTFCFLFLWFGPRRAVGRGEQPNPNVDAQLGRLSTECPDQTKAGKRNRANLFIFAVVLRVAS